MPPAAISAAARRALGAEAKAWAVRSEQGHNDLGVPMFLILEDALENNHEGAGFEPGGVLHDALLALSAGLIMESLAPEEIGPDEIALTLELLAAHFFTLGLSEELR